MNDLQIESFTHRKSDPIPDLSHHFEYILHVYSTGGMDANHLNSHILFGMKNIEKQIQNGTKDEMKVFYYTLGDKP